MKTIIKRRNKMPSGQRQDPYRRFRFRVEIDGIVQAGFSECIFGSDLTDMIEYREGNEPPVVRKLSGLTRYGNIILKWGITDSMELNDWRQRVKDSGAEKERKNMSIILIDETGVDKARWDIVNAWPFRYDPPDFNARGNEVAIETLEIVHEGFQKVK
jgi:phage tail-like protein